MNEVVTTVLPHPISMFMLGGMLLGIIILFREYRSLTSRIKDLKQDFEKVMDKMDRHSSSIDEKIQTISKKVDSRVDKALLSIKK